ADSDQQAAIAGESVIENGPVEACAGQIGGDSFALADDHEVVRSGSVLAAANESKALAVGSHADAAEGPARSEDRRQSIVGKPKNEDAAGVLIGLRTVGGTEQQLLAIRMPRDFFDGPLRFGESFGFAGGKSEKPEPRVLVFFVDDVGVVFV